MNRTRNILLAAISILWGLGPVSGEAQGIVRFANSGPGLNAPVTNSVTGQLVGGSGYLVQLYGGAAGSLESALAPLRVPVTFMPGGLAGYFDGGLATNAFVAAGAVGAFQVRAWSAGFATYEEAFSAGLVDPNVLVGKSAHFDNATGSSSGAVLTGLTGFAIAPVPEPGTISYLVIGAGIAFWRFRR